MELPLKVNHFVEVGREKYPTRRDPIEGIVTRRAEGQHIFNLTDTISIDDPKFLEPAKLE